MQQGEVTFLDDSAHVAPAGSVVYLAPRHWITVENHSGAPARIRFAFPGGAVERHARARPVRPPPGSGVGRPHTIWRRRDP